MSSFVGHSLSAIAIYFSQQRDRRSRYRLFWLIWLIIIASSPDIDYFIPAFYSSANQGLRITHSLLFITILPGCIIFSLKFLSEFYLALAN